MPPLWIIKFSRLGGLQRIFDNIVDKAGIRSGLFASILWARKKLQYRKKDGTFPPLDPSTELIPSFYTGDIVQIKKNPGAQIKRYVESLDSAVCTRTQIDCDVASMQKWLQADRFPKGVWPSEYSPSLMQQLSINLAVSDPELFSVNGLPGIGKITLLKEIIVANIINRATLMAGYATPNDAFEKQEFDDPPNQYNRTFYRPDRNLSFFGILVASNNNAAVENISVELPKIISKDRTGLFSTTEETSKTYFSDIATALLDEPAWELISAKLGKKENLNNLKDKLWWNKESTTLRDYYESKESIPDWDRAKEAFLKALKAVEAEQARIAEVQERYITSMSN